MRNSRKLLTGLSIFVLVVGLSACGGGRNQTNATDSLTLKTYTVPDGRAKDLSRTLNRVLSMGSGKNETGKAWFSGSQQILVLAPQRMQDSIASSIKEMAGKNPNTTSSPQPLRLNAWVVDAYAGKGPADPALAEIQPALAAFSKAMGPTHYSEAHYLTAVSDVDSQTTLMPLPGQRFSYRITRRGNGLVLRFDYSDNQRYPVPHGQAVSQLGLQGQTVTQLGKTLVLGLISEQTAKGSADNTGGAVVHRLLVVRLTSVSQG